MATIRIKPAPGRRVRNPDRNFRVMPADGEDVEDTIHWRRAIDAGDVLVVEAAAAAPASPKPRAAKS